MHPESGQAGEYADWKVAGRRRTDGCKSAWSEPGPSSGRGVASAIAASTSGLDAVACFSYGSFGPVCVSSRASVRRGLDLPNGQWCGHSGRSAANRGGEQVRGRRFTDHASRGGEYFQHGSG